MILAQLAALEGLVEVKVQRLRRASARNLQKHLALEGNGLNQYPNSDLKAVSARYGPHSAWTLSGRILFCASREYAERPVLRYYRPFPAGDQPLLPIFCLFCVFVKFESACLFKALYAHLQKMGVTLVARPLHVDRERERVDERRSAPHQLLY